MKLAVERADLLRAVEPAARVIQKRNLIPILNNVCLRADADRLTITATDLDIEIRTTTSASVYEPGAVTVPAGPFFDLVRRLPDGAQIGLSQTDDKTRLSVQAGRSHTRLPTLPADEYPDIVSEELTHSFAMQTDALAALMRDTIFAASTEPSLNHICGVRLHEASYSGGTRLAAAGTDGHRMLSRRLAPVPDGAAGMPGITIPTKTVGEIIRLIDKMKGEVSIELNARKIRVTLGQTVLTSSLIQGEFPDYNQIIPKASPRIVTIEADALTSAIGRISITADSDAKRGTALTFTNQLLTLTIANQASGDAREEVECDYEGEPFKIGFDHSFLSKILNVLGGDTVLMKMDQEMTVTQFMTREGSDLLALLAPMRA